MAGSKSDCELNSGNKVKHCESGKCNKWCRHVAYRVEFTSYVVYGMSSPNQGNSKKTITRLKVELGIVSTLLVILGLICLAYLYKKCLHHRCVGICRACCRRRRGYQPVDEQPVNQPLINQNNEEN